LDEKNRAILEDGLRNLEQGLLLLDLLMMNIDKQREDYIAQRNDVSRRIASTRRELGTEARIN
jgi:hypothetical protein